MNGPGRPAWGREDGALTRLLGALLIAAVLVPAAGAAEAPLPQDGDYAARMKAVAARGNGRAGVVLHVGDSITYASPYGQWARSGEGRTAEDRALLSWSHAGADDETDGWWLARADHPDGGRSYTASSGLRLDELLAGGKNGLPALAALLDQYRPQAVVLMLGTNDVTARRDPDAYRADLRRAVGLLVDRGVVPVVSTIPPYPGREALAAQYSEIVRATAKAQGLPLIDYEREVLKRRPTDWNGTLLGKDDAHPSATFRSTTAASAPTAENLRNSGYLLRGWLSVRKLVEVKSRVFDAPRAAAPAPRLAGASARPKPSGPSVRLPVTRDTWFSNVGSEGDGNNGGSARLKLKSHQEMALLDVATEALRGRVVTGASLHLRLGAETPLRRVTVGSFAAEWSEGTGTSYTPEPGSSTFRHRRHPGVPWSFPGSDLTSVILGQGGSVWRMAEAGPPDSQGWQEVAVSPSVVAARVAGVSQGFFLFDDTGSEWSREGERFTANRMPNRFVFSKDSNAASAPYLTVTLGPSDRQPPEAPGAITSDAADLPAGEAYVSWTTPKDRGEAGTVGFFVKVDGKEAPRYLVPAAGRTGEAVRMHLRDLGLRPGAAVSLAVRGVDGAGNVGPQVAATVRVSGRSARALAGKALEAFRGAGPLPKVGGAEIAVIDELDKVQPVTGAMVPPQPEGHLAANHLWDGAGRAVRLHAARNEFVAFQVLIRGAVRGLRPELTFAGTDIRAEFGTYVHVATKAGPLPDPVVPLTGAFAVPSGEGIVGQKSGSLHCEVYVPHDAKAGLHKGRLTLSAGGETLALDVTLTVWDFTLPDSLSFLAEMNCYDLPADERAYYRMAHRHRTVLNRVPYSHRGEVAEGCAPGRKGGAFDWSGWDRRFGPYFDGSAFADLPRKSVPIEAFYLPIHENWPVPIERHYNGDYWADRAFTEEYRREFVAAARAFAAHLNAEGWGETFFQFYLNGKNEYKSGGWSHSTSPWLLDEPASFQDFWALRWFGRAFHEGTRQAPGKARLAFRCDISRPEWQRDSLDGLLDYDVVGGAFRPYRRLVLDRKGRTGELVVEYGSSNAVEAANVQPVGWCLDAWSLGADGVLPWQTLGNAGSWKEGDSLALFYPPRDGAGGAPVPSVRLKAYRRGQQDVEYLTLLGQLQGEPRWALGLRVREALRLAGERQASGLDAVEDAGVIEFSGLKPQELWALRVRVGGALDEARPAPRRRLVELRTPARDPSRLAPRPVSEEGGR